jgi:hypothetical protein
MRLVPLICALAVLLAAALPAAVQSEPAGVAPATPLVVNNREIFVFRATLSGYMPEQRAHAAQQRLEEALEKGVGPTVTVVPMEDTRLIELGGVGLFFIAPADVDPASGEAVDALATRVVARLTQALAETREARDLAVMARAAVAVALATFLLVALVWLLSRGTRWLGGFAHALASRAAERVRIGGYRALSPAALGSLARTAVRLAGWAIGLFLGYLWLAFALKRFPYTRPWAEALLEFLLRVLGTVANGIVHAVPGLVFVAVIIVITRVIARSVGIFLRQVETGRVTVGWLDADTAAPTRRILMVLLWLFALAMAYPYLPGSGSEAFKGLSVLVGLMISIGASGIVGQGAGGLMQTALSDFYVEYRLVCFAGPEAPQRRALVLDALHANIQDVFNEFGVQIMSPHYMADPPQPQIVPKEEWHTPPARPPGDNSRSGNGES